MRNKILKLIAVLTGAVLLGGCGSGFSETDQEFRELAQKERLSGSTITLMASADWVTDAEKELGTNFEAATGIQVIYDTYTDDVYLDTLFARLGSNPPDLFMMQSGLAIQKTYGLDQYAVSLSDEPWMAYYNEFSAMETSIDGKNYGMSYFDNTTDYYLIYNKKILENAGVTAVPANFSDFEDMCRKVMAAGVIPIYEPMADGWHQTMLFAESGQIFEKHEPGIVEKLNQNEVKFSEIEEMNVVLERIRKLALAGYMGKTFATDRYDDAIGYLANGEYAMCLLRPGMVESILSSDMNKGYRKEDFGLMLFPVGDDQILNVHPTGPSKFISKASGNIEAAKLYLRYISSKDNVQYVINHSNSVNDLPFELGQTTTHDKTTREFLAQFDDEHSGMVLQDVVTYFNEQWGDISTDILKMCEGKVSAQEVLEQIDERRTALAEAAGDEAWQ